MIDLNWEKSALSKSGKVIVLRYIREDDAAGLLDFINPIVEENTFILLNEKQSLENEQVYVSECINELQQEKLLKILAMDGNKIIGVCDVVRGRYKHDHTGTLGISVHKVYRDDGIGRVLISEAITQAREILQLDLVELICMASNVTAQKLYTSLGFLEFGRLPHAYIQNGAYIDGVYMYKPLTNG